MLQRVNSEQQAKKSQNGQEITVCQNPELVAEPKQHARSNQTLLMRNRRGGMPSQPPLRPSQGFVLQRKCACGEPSVAGSECEECKTNKHLGLQTKLTISEPGDSFEQEADRVADQVMATNTNYTVNSTPLRIQRYVGQETAGLDSAPNSQDRILLSSGISLVSPLQQGMKQNFGHDFSRVKGRIYPIGEQSALNKNSHNSTVKQDSGLGTNRFVPEMNERLHSSHYELMDPSHPVRRLSESRSGRPLPTYLRARMGTSFGYDFSSVRVHDGSLAAEATQSVDAVAYTLGQDIAFASGTYRPDTPAGLHLLAHELTHVVQQGGATQLQNQTLIVDPVDDPLENDANTAADRILVGERVTPQRLGAGKIRRLQRSVSKVCNPPSVWFVLGGPQNLPAAQAFGAIAELFISTDVISRNGVSFGNFYLDNPIAGPIDPALVAFIIAKNPGLSLANKIALAAAMLARPDVLMHQVPLTEFEEVKPNSVAGRAAGRVKVRTIDGFYSSLGLPYTAGSNYTPPPPFVIASGSIGTVPIVITFEITRDRNGLLVYDICVETDWLIVSLAAIAIVIAIILLLLSKGAVRPVPLPVPAPLPLPVPAPVPVPVPAPVPVPVPALGDVSPQIPETETATEDVGTTNEGVAVNESEGDNIDESEGDNVG